MSKVPQYNQHEPLKTLLRVLEISKKQRKFSLKFVRCNEQSLQFEILQILKEKYEIDLLCLPKSTSSLHKAIQSKIEQGNFDALIVSNLDSVSDLDRLLLTIDHERETLQNSYPFLLVLWVDDEIWKKLLRQAPNFTNYCPVPVVIWNHENTS